MRCRGMTLIELMVVMAIVGIFLGYGIPAFRNYLDNSKIRAAADSLTSGLNRARTEAIMRNTVVTFTPTTTGWQITLPAVGGQPEEVVAMSPPAAFAESVVMTPSVNSLSFNGRGRTTSVGGFSITLTDPTKGTCAEAGGDIRCLNINVTGSGQTKLCDPALAASDPRSC